MRILIDDILSVVFVYGFFFVFYPALIIFALLALRDENKSTKVISDRPISSKKQQTKFPKIRIKRHLIPESWKKVLRGETLLK